MYAMRIYESMVILDPQLDATDTKKIEELIRKLMGEYAPQITKIEHLGKKQLKYKIMKQNEGIYALVTLRADGIKSSAIQKQAKLNPEILRYLMLHEA
ncbi:30S ribosomal protein S6 [Candidatus Gottesmanbacteria bacterium RBG_16_43_7]|uniref:Small ribosomal subunit protein bS6 n=1 Tax=Candidatus Gottesmanbacteria bacterium RBG_16_43_7 TaxID=1798373 RepID=A0A1F5ZCC8_9BACT|nr:MAG: 30S ribosomal protein S6 [Candidatus Gottesmanbacteria bacterium RBG_16_43_7]